MSQLTLDSLPAEDLALIEEALKAMDPYLAMYHIEWSEPCALPSSK